jgi:type 1 glutamine amidotransferase
MRGTITTLVAVGCGVVAISVAGGARTASTDPPRILVFSKTAAFRHDSIPAALAAVSELAIANGIVVDATEDSAAFNPERLRRYDAVVFLMTTGDVLDDAQQRAFERFFRAGGGYVGIHSAADTEYGWPWYGQLLGTRFRNHPQIQRGTITVSRRNHPSTAGLPRRWTRTDEWYNFASKLSPSVRVLARLDESTYAPGDGAMGANHPIAWFHEFQGGRAWYTGGGHTKESYREPLFRRHLIGGIRYAAGLSPPRIASVALRARDGRVSASVRYSSCRPCRGLLSVGSNRTRLRVSDGRGTGTSRPVRRGRRSVSVTLTDPRTGLSDSLRKVVIVR